MTIGILMDEGPNQRAMTAFYLQGVFAENKEKLIKDALSAILTQPPPGSDTSVRDSLPGVGSRTVDRQSAVLQGDPNLHLILREAQFHALRRLVASKAGFNAFTQLPG